VWCKILTSKSSFCALVDFSFAYDAFVAMPGQPKPSSLNLKPEGQECVFVYDVRLSEVLQLGSAAGGRRASTAANTQRDRYLRHDATTAAD